MTHIQRTCKTRRGVIVLAVAVLALLMGAVVLPRTGAKAVESTMKTETIDSGTGTATVHATTNNMDYSVSFAMECTKTYPSTKPEMAMYSTVVTFDFSSLPPEYVNLVLVRPKKYGDANVTFAGNTMTFAAESFSNSATLQDIYFTCELAWTMIPLPEPPTKEGYTFTGWYTDEACTNKYVGETVRDDMTLYAGWQINRYTVTYDSNGGSSCESVTVDWNTSPTLPTPTRTGYTFVGWFDGETQYEGAPVKANKNLVAHWQIMTFTVTFMSDGAVYKQITVDYGTSLVEAMETAEIASYAAYTDEGVRLSKQNSVITENTQVLVQDLSGWEKYGDFVARSPWYTWLTVGVLGALALTTVVMAIVIKRG